MSPHLLIWLPLAWLLPALLGHALGWSGLWGGAALPDLLWPLPVAGGALHVPSFVLCAVLVKLLPGASDRVAARLQALLLGLALALALWLLRLDGMWVSWRSTTGFMPPVPEACSGGPRPSFQADGPGAGR